MISGPIEADTEKPLEKAYQLFESVVSALQIHLQNTKEDQKEETSRLLRQQYTTFLEAHKVLQGHLEESIITTEVLHDWPTYHGQVIQQTLQSREQIQVLEKRQGINEKMRSTIQYHIVLETTKLEKLERQAHQWVTASTIEPRQTGYNLPAERLLDSVEEKYKVMGPDMESIADLSIQ